MKKILEKPDKEITFEGTDNGLEKAYVNNITEAVKAISLRKDGPVIIMDQATGSNDTDHYVIRQLNLLGVDYRFIMCDHNPVLMSLGYAKLEDNLETGEFDRVCAVVADLRDLRKEIKKVRRWEENDGNYKFRSRKIPLTYIFDNYAGRFEFLKTGHDESGKRKIPFDNRSIDVLIGWTPYTSINNGSYEKALNESVRVLAPGGYLVVIESQVTLINPDVSRTRRALKEAKKSHLDIISDMLDAKLVSLMDKKEIRQITTYRNRDESKEQRIQYGDELIWQILSYQKKAD